MKRLSCVWQGYFQRHRETVGSNIFFRKRYLCYFSSEWQELFQPSPIGAVCWTHDLLACRCQNGSTAKNSEALPKTDVPLHEEEDTRAFQLGRSGKRFRIDQEAVSSSTNGLEQVKKWSHFLTPEAILETAPLLSPPSSLKAVFQHITSASE